MSKSAGATKAAISIARAREHDAFSVFAPKDRTAFANLLEVPDLHHEVVEGVWPYTHGPLDAVVLIRA